MEFKTDKYTKIILTIIAVTLILLLFKPQVQQSLTPPSAHALSKLEGVNTETGTPISLTDVYVRNTDGVPVPVKQTGKIEVYWEKPLPVYIVEQKK